MCALNKRREVSSVDMIQNGHVVVGHNMQDTTTGARKATGKPRRVRIQVGEKHFVESEEVLARSLALRDLLNGVRSKKTPLVSELRLNRNPATFSYILHFLRKQRVGKLPSEMSEIYKIYRESQFFRLDKLTNQIEGRFPDIVEYSTPTTTSTHTLPHPTTLKIEEESLIDIEDSANLEKAPCLSNAPNRPHICSLSLPNQCLCRELQGLLHEQTTTKPQNTCSSDGSCCESLEHRDDVKIDLAREISKPEISGNSDSLEGEKIPSLSIDLCVAQEECQTPKDFAGTEISPKSLKIDTSDRSSEVDNISQGDEGVAGVKEARSERAVAEGTHSESAVAQGTRSESTAAEGTPVEALLELEEKETVCEPLVKTEKLVLHKDKRKNLFSWEEIRKHNSADDCWLVNKGKVYDVTEMLGHHPAGLDAIVRHGGTDAERHFKFHSRIARGFWRKYEIGRVKGETSCVVM